MKLDIKILLKRGVEELIGEEDLIEKLKAKKKLRVKYGIDPTAPDLHLGHAVLLRKLRQFQDAGHKAVLIIGDATALIGDPSGRTETRPMITEKEVKKNMRDYLLQIGKIINLKKAEVRRNSEWLKKSPAKTILELSLTGSIQQVLHRADFKKRLKKGQDITMTEMMYPLLQGYDSVQVKADLELGGTDQKFNLLMGRRIQKHYKMDKQAIITMPILEGTDGVNKMSKSAGNYIALNEGPEEMFGKIMSISDKLMPKYFELLTDIDPIPFKMIKKEPRNSKILLAKTIVANLHSQSAAVRAMANFVRIFSKKESPNDIPVIVRSVKWGEEISLTDLLLEAGVGSKNEAKRLIKQKGVRIDGQVKVDPFEKIKIKDGSELRIGKRKFFRISS